MVDDLEVLLLLLPILNEEGAIEVALVREDVVPGVNKKTFQILVQIYFTWVVSKYELARILLWKPILRFLVIFFIILIIILVAPSVLLPAIKPLYMNNVIGQILSFWHH